MRGRACVKIGLQGRSDISADAWQLNKHCRNRRNDLCEPVKFRVVVVDPARTHEMTKTVLGFTRVLFSNKTGTKKTVEKPYKSRKETTSVRQQSHPKQCMTMPWHQGHSVITCMTIASHAWLPSWNRYIHTQSKHFVIFYTKTTNYKLYWLPSKYLSHNGLIWPVLTWQSQG